jgi:hypothetical protein
MFDTDLIILTFVIDHLHDAAAGSEHRMTGFLFGTDLIIILASTSAAEREYLWSLVHGWRFVTDVTLLAPPKREH